MKNAVLIIIVSFVVCFNALAIEITPNSVYRVKNNTERYLAVSANNAVTAVGNANDNKQEWYFEPNGDNSAFYLRNLQSGAYLTSPRAIYTTWQLTQTSDKTDDMAMVFSEYSGDVVFHSKAYTTGSSYAHNDGSNNVVCWSLPNSPHSRWTLEPVEKTPEQLAEILEHFETVGNELANTDKYESILDNLFTDKSYSELKDKNINLDSNDDYLALSPRLQKMVKKIKDGSDEAWGENYTYQGEDYQWRGDYVRRYRVQMYEPYSEGADAAFMAGIQPYTNMNNPTGIVGDKDDLIYIMVKDAVPEGATLYINEAPDAGMYNGTTSGIKLHQGLNTLLCNNNNSHFFIYYTVNTADIISSRMQHTQYNLNNFSPIKIHIEGGRVNGFFNYIGDDMYGHDTEEQFLYTLARATHPMYDFIGKYVILHMHLNDTPKKEGMSDLIPCVRTIFTTGRKDQTGYEYDPVKIMTAWDKMCLSERVLMGITSDEETNDSYNRGMYESIVGSKESFTTPDGKVYSMDPGFHYNEYFNNRMMGISMQGDLFMNATYYRTAYCVTTIESILTQFCDGNIWGPAHEYGHNNQDPLKMAGTTEVSNNIFSNVATFYQGIYTSRTDYLTNQFNIFQERKTYLENGTWGTTRMYWQLWCYYHATKHNKKFYPRLIELLRNNPLKHTTIPNEHRELTDKLHFVKMCCIAAQEDLTNFFESWGFFVPLDGYEIGDYSSYRAYLTQDEIDAFKAEIKSYRFPVNNAIILIDDRPGLSDDPLNNRKSYPGTNMIQGGDFGGLADFTDDKANPSGSFGFSVKGSTVTVEMDGDPGVGYLIWDQDGNLLGFSNTNTFNVNNELASKLLSGEAIVRAVGADNVTNVDVVNMITDGTPSQKKKILKELLDDTDNYKQYVDQTKTKVGYLLPEAFDEFMKYIEETKSLLDDDGVEGAVLTRAIKSVTESLNSLLTSPESLVGIESDFTYEIKNFVVNGTNSFFLSVKDAKAAVKTSTDISGSEGMYRYETEWIFEKQANDYYYIFNPTHNKYLSASSDGYIMSFTPFEFKLLPVPNKQGYFYISAKGATSDCVAMINGSIVNNESGINQAQWSITKKTDFALTKDRNSLGALLNIAKRLVDEDAAEYWYSLGEDFEKWYEFYQYLENDIAPVRTACNNVLVNSKSTPEQLKESEAKLYATLKELATRIGIPFGSLTVGTSNDCKDNNTDENVIRCAFNASSGGETSIILTELMSSDGNTFNADDLAITVTPVGVESWASSSAMQQDDLDNDYEAAFNYAAPEAGLYDKYLALGSKRVDGFFTSASCHLEDAGTDADGNKVFTVIVEVPCSGVYDVNISLVDKGYLLLTPTYGDPWFKLEVYPNLVSAFGSEAGFNIEGITFDGEDFANESVIALPGSFEPEEGWERCNAFIPGTYFVNDFRITIDEDAVVKEKLEEDRPDGPQNVKRRNEGYVSSTDASVYYAPVNLSSLANLPGGTNVKANVVVTKNGAKGNYTFYINKQSSELTGIEPIESATHETAVYYNLHGLMVKNPTKGVYIKVVGGKASKVIL